MSKISTKNITIIFLVTLMSAAAIALPLTITKTKTKKRANKRKIVKCHIVQKKHAYKKQIQKKQTHLLNKPLKKVKTVERVATPATDFNPTPTINSLVHNNEGLSPKLLKMGLNAYHYAQEHGGVKRKILTIVDLSAPSKNKRLWVINLNTDRIEAHTLVANGKNSGLYRATRFSNQPGTDESSVGVFLTGNTFYGNDGYSMRIIGLEKGINNNVYRREIVMHPAWYVSEAFAKAHGRVGRSWGCFALNKEKAPKIINMVKGGSVLFAFGAPENHDPVVDSGITA